MTGVPDLAAAGVSVWLDDLGRHRIDSGELTRLIDEVGIVGVTTNPSIFAAAVRGSTEYDDRLAGQSTSPDDALRDLMVRDVQDACTLFSSTFQDTEWVDGRVSLEVDPHLAFDTTRTIADAAQIWRDVDRPNVMVKIPATAEGLPAITETLAAGISVNVTLIFGLDRYGDVQDAWATGMEAALANGHDLSAIGSVASFFVSRLDTAVDKRLDALATADRISPDLYQTLRGGAAVANARRAYRSFRSASETPRWQALRDAGARPQRPLWASTSTKDPTFATTRYVDELVARDTVNTMPVATLDAVVAGQSSAAATIELDSAAETADIDHFARLAEVGIAYDDVVAELERDGVQAFIAAWDALLELVATAQARVAPTQ